MPSTFTTSGVDEPATKRCVSCCRYWVASVERVCSSILIPGLACSNAAIAAFVASPSVPRPGAANVSVTGPSSAEPPPAPQPASASRAAARQPASLFEIDTGLFPFSADGLPWRRRRSGDADVDGEDGACRRLHVREPVAGRGDVEDAAAEAAARRPDHWQPDHGVEPPVRGVAADGGAGPERDPETTVVVDAEPVGRARARRDGNDDARVADVAGVVVVGVAADRLGGRVDEVELAPVGAPTEPVAGRHAGDHDRR